jgi:toxin FitB
LTRFLLDTNIVSAVTRPQPEPALIAWLENQTDDTLFTTVLTLAEIHRGILILPDGQKRKALHEWFHGPEGPTALFGNRILPFDVAAALQWSNLMAAQRLEGRTRGAIDTMIAAIAKVHDCVVVTLNDRDFPDVPVFNPVAPVR